MQIGQLASRAGISIATVRYYERNNILPSPPRQETGFRAYGEEDIARLQFLQRARTLGFSLPEIRELLTLSQQEGGDSCALKSAAIERLQDVESKLADLGRIRDGLLELIADCPNRPEPGRCPVLAALVPDDGTAAAGS
ncbi:heavy metal-responsive transcriptional regulator [Montanilutibacter psychrotolerans]|nr:heavy metal-responsive transcriptional regulator [Lysobacter psychrotolerans]